MKPKNFPARKLCRRLEAAGRAEKRALSADEEAQIDLARLTRTKKDRSARGARR